MLRHYYAFARWLWFEAYGHFLISRIPHLPRSRVTDFLEDAVYKVRRYHIHNATEISDDEIRLNACSCLGHSNCFSLQFQNRPISDQFALDPLIEGTVGLCMIQLGQRRNDAAMNVKGHEKWQAWHKWATNLGKSS